MIIPPPPILQFFFENPLIKIDAPHSPPHLTIKPPIWETTSPHWKVKPPSRKWFLEKIQKKSETVINTCTWIIKQHWKKIAEIPQESDFITWSIKNFVRKVKQFVKKYYITWLITQLIVIDIAPLTVLFCNYPLVDL